jgi:hypothetical protein
MLAPDRSKQGSRTVGSRRIPALQILRSAIKDAEGAPGRVGPRRDRAEKIGGMILVDGDPAMNMSALLRVFDRIKNGKLFAA